MIYYCSSDSDLSTITPSLGDTILLKSGSKFSIQALPTNVISFSNITLGYYGTGEVPVISGGTLRRDWIFNNANNVYYRQYTNEKLGNVTEDGVPMKFVSWRGNLTDTAAAMSSSKNGNLWSGSMSFDTTNNILYIRPSSGTASQHEYIVSDANRTNGGGIGSSANTKGVSIRDVELRHISRHGLGILNAKDLTIDNYTGRFIGGAWDGAYHLGNALEISAGCHGTKVTNCRAFDVFDTGFTSQLYDSSLSFLSGGYYENIRVERYGMHGLEFSTHSVRQTLSDIEIQNVVGVDGGANSWAGDRNGALIGIVSNNITSIITRVFANNVQALRCRRLYLGYNHNGVCGIENSSSVQSLLGSLGLNNTGGSQIDLCNNLVENLPFSGISQVTGQLSSNFTSSLL